MQEKSWTFTTFENGQADRVATDLSPAQAVQAIKRAMIGLDPFEDESTPLPSAPAQRSEAKLPAAA
jgi:hypothetical protein